MIRVIHLASGREWRGGQRQVLLLARGLAAVPDIDVSVMTGRGTLLDDRLAASGVTVRAVPWGPGLDPRVAMHLVGTLHARHHRARPRQSCICIGRCRDPMEKRSGHRYPPRHAAHPPSAPLSASGRRDRHFRGRSPAADRRGRGCATHSDRAGRGGYRGGRVLAPVGAGRVPRSSASPRFAVKGIDVCSTRQPSAHTRPDARWIVLGEGPERRQLEQQRATLGLDEHRGASRLRRDPRVSPLPGHGRGPAISRRGTLLLGARGARAGRARGRHRRGRTARGAGPGRRRAGPAGVSRWNSQPSSSVC